ncbi:MAG: type VI secretion system ATPase TssH [Acidobacteriaceae bacterium]
MGLNLKALIGKLNDPTRSALEGAAGLCLSRTHYDVEVEHFLTKLLDSTSGDLAAIIRHFELDRSRLTAELTRSLDKLKSGNARTPAISPTLLKMLTVAWTIGSIDFGASQVRGAFAVLALVSDEELSRLIHEVSSELRKINPDTLRRDLLAIVALSNETAAAADTLMPGEAGRPATGRTPNLDQYTVDLTGNARKGKIDPVLGRDPEIRQIIDILTRRRQNNPILTGEAGVGKTAVVEGFALRVAQGDIPPTLRNVQVRTLDLALLQAGAGVKGEFENRLKGLIEEVKASTVPVILFIDEAHTMIGAGGQAGQNDAANLLKPALARGELRTIAATTWSEYKKYFEKDAALARRFQVVKVEEPSEAQCAIMMRGLVAPLEKHHNVRILDEAVFASVRLTHRYLAGRQLPDKAVSILDTACARLALGQNTTPPALEDLHRQIDALAVRKRILEREEAVGADHGEGLAEIAAQQEKAEEQLIFLQSRWDRERELVGKIRNLRDRLETGPSHEGGGSPAKAVASRAAAKQNVQVQMANTAVAVAEPPADDAISALAATKEELRALEAELSALQGETGLIRVCVDAQTVGEVLSAWTGIPAGKMLKDEIAAILALQQHLAKRVIGQDHAMEIIGQRVQTSRASLDDPNKPVGVFMLVGPSGVGKTETALALSDLLYGGEHNLITINMSEFQEPHTVSTLKGSPPGYVGYGEGGVLTEAVRRRPYSVVLLDEVEKAHPDVLELFFQVFDKGVMEDGEGREIDFRNTIILLTTNACTDQLMKLVADPETAPGPRALVDTIKPELNRIFKPAFLGRMVIIPYYPVRDEALKQIIRLKLGKIQRRLLDNHQVSLSYDDVFLETVANRCTEVESGARNVDNILTNSLLPDISRKILGGMAGGERFQAIRVTVDESGEFAYA